MSPLLYLAVKAIVAVMAVVAVLAVAEQKSIVRMSQC